jgi:SAM-dependent methyltransferase
MDLDENRKVWNNYDVWHSDGDDWSAPWGSAEAQWTVSILPRVCGLLPAHTILEIGCGCGRWTRFLRSHCQQLIGLDLSPVAIERCRLRFADDKQATFVLNDGRSLDGVPDESVDFVFSFDSLVHADHEVMSGYLDQLRRKLRVGGCALLHHSNLGAYVRGGSDGTRPTLLGALRGVGWLQRNLHWRDPTVSAKGVRRLAHISQLECARQELVPWRDCDLLIDCFTTLLKRSKSRSIPTPLTRNRHFMLEAVRARRIASGPNPT